MGEERDGFRYTDYTTWKVITEFGTSFLDFPSKLSTDTIKQKIEQERAPVLRLKIWHNRDRGIFYGTQYLSWRIETCKNIEFIFFHSSLREKAIEEKLIEHGYTCIHNMEQQNVFFADLRYIQKPL